MIAALVPVKRLEVAKSRMRAGLDAAALPGLTLAMLEDVVAALQASPELEVVAVVTEDERVAEAARKAGARALLRDDDGLNPSLEAAGAELAAEGAHALLIVLGDVPGITPADVGVMVRAQADLGPRGMVLVPARDGGTAALLRTPRDIVPCAFGEDSAARHRAHARRLGVPHRELVLPGLAVDLDRPEDVEAFLAGPGHGPRTRALLASLDRGVRT